MFSEKEISGTCNTLTNSFSLSLAEQMFGEQNKMSFTFAKHK